MNPAWTLILVGRLALFLCTLSLHGNPLPRYEINKKFQSNLHDVITGYAKSKRFIKLGNSDIILIQIKCNGICKMYIFSMSKNEFNTLAAECNLLDFGFSSMNGIDLAVFCDDENYFLNSKSLINVNWYTPRRVMDENGNIVPSYIEPVASLYVLEKHMFEFKKNVNFDVNSLGQNSQTGTTGSPPPN